MTGRSRFAASRVLSRTRPGGRRGLVAAGVLVVVVTAGFPFQEALALITGGTGNRPIADPGWPQGAAALVNHPSRIAWWEGPPFGGGQWHAECRGDARAFNAVLADFARLDVKVKRLVVHDGVGESFWLNPNREPAKRDGARVDWVVMVWQPASWERLRKLPVDLNPVPRGGADKGPPAQIDVFTGGNVHWADVTVPPGLEVDDQRLEAHGFTPADGSVLEGTVIDLATKQPVAARVRLERVEPQQSGYRYTKAVEAAAEARGRWVVRKAPVGWFRVVAEADGYVSRVLGYVQLDDQPGWRSYDGGLSRPGPVSGRVTDDEGRPLAGVDVRIGDVTSGDTGRYETPRDSPWRTDADGRFRADELPLGRATVWVSRDGYCRPGLGLPITLPSNDVALTMMKSAEVHISVDFTGKERPGGYVVHMVPEGGEAVVNGRGRVTSTRRIGSRSATCRRGVTSCTGNRTRAPPTRRPSPSRLT